MVSKKSTAKRLAPITWVRTERELVAYESVRIYKEQGLAFSKCIVLAQQNVLPEGRHRPEHSLYGAAEGLRILGEDMHAKRLVVPAAPLEQKPAPAPVEVETKQPELELKPAEVAVPATHHFGDLLERATALMVDDFKSKINLKLEAELQSVFAGVDEQIKRRTDELLKLEARLKQRTEFVTTLTGRAEDALTTLGELASNLDDHLHSINTLYKKATAENQAFILNSKNQLLDFQEIRSNVSDDLAELQRLIQSCQEAESEVEGLEARANVQLSVRSTQPTQAELVEKVSYEQPPKVVVPKATPVKRLPRVLVLGANSGHMKTLTAEYGDVLDLVFHGPDASKKVKGMAKSADFVVMAQTVGPGMKEMVKDHPGFRLTLGGMHSIKELLLQIAVEA